MDLSRRGFLGALAGAVATTALVRVESITGWSEPKAAPKPKQRLCRALSGLANLNKFELYIKLKGGTYKCVGQRNIDASKDGEISIQFPDWRASWSDTAIGALVVDDEGFIVSEKPFPANYHIFPGDAVKIYYRLGA